MEIARSVIFSSQLGEKIGWHLKYIQSRKYSYPILFINRCSIRRHIEFSLILTSFRGFCLLISKINTAGISAKESAQILYSTLFQSNKLNL
jgi:hypothetical protein